MLTASEAKEQILARVTTSYGVTNLNPCLPEVDLQRIQDQYMSDDDRCSRTWDDWHQNVEEAAFEFWDGQHPDYKEFFEVPDWMARRLGLLTLPRDLLRGAHKLVFGVVTDEPTGFAIDVLTLALFVGGDWRRNRRWLQEVYSAAKTEQERRLKLQAEVDHLLAALEV